MSDRTKLKIISCESAPRQAGQAEVLEFIAQKEGDNKNERYGVWNKALYPHIQAGATLDAEIEVKTSEKKDREGNPYINRKVTQIYVNGSPIIEQKRQGGFGGGSRQESPETRRSMKSRGL